MGTINVTPIQTQIVLQGSFLREESLLDSIDITQVLKEVVGRTIDWQEVSLAVTSHQEIETVADEECLRYLILRTDIQVNLGSLGIVLVLTRRILQNPIRIAKRLIDSLVA